MRNLTVPLIAIWVASAAVAVAEAPEIVDVTAQKDGMAWRFEVTLLHPDTGWDHYANSWEVLDADGNRLGFRKLLHPHQDEQPFTRSLNSIVVPDGTREVYFRASCSVEKWSGPLVPVALPF